MPDDESVEPESPVDPVPPAPPAAEPAQPVALVQPAPPITANTQIQAVPPDNSTAVSATERFRGELTLRAQVLRILWSTLGGLLVLGLFVLYQKPDSFDEYANRVFPIVS